MLLLAACGNEPRPVIQLPDPPPIDESTALTNDSIDNSSFGQFLVYYRQLVSSIDNNDPRSFNGFIHPEYGLCIIEQNGAMPQMRNGKDISRYKTVAGKTLFEADKSKLHCELKEEELPRVDCNKPELWSKAGCFTQEVNTFKDEKIWEYCNLQKKEQEIAAKSAATITRTVINTAGYRFYFSRIEGRWYLTFIDLRVPCSA